MQNKKVGILRGGTESYYDNSLRRGSEIILYIHEKLADKFTVVDILVDKENIWHMNGMPIKPVDLVGKVDIIWNLSDPSFSQILKSFSIPTIGVDFFSSALGEDRDFLKEHTKNINIKIPRHILLPVYQKDFDGEEEQYIYKKTKEVFEKFGGPWVVKSFTPESNMGIHLAKTFPELGESIRDGIKHNKSILIEEFISGKVAPVHSISKLRNEDIYIFPPIDFSKEEKDKLISMTKDLHSHLNINHYLKSNFIVHPRMGIYLNSIDFMPDFKEGSHLSLACDSVGIKVESILEHMFNKDL